MQLVGAGGRLFLLEVTGYEFPTNSNPPGHDWLEVKGQVCDGTNTWDIEGALLFASELTKLARWLTALSRGELDPKEPFLFYEPASIWMEMAAPSTIRVGFGGAGLEWNVDAAQPPWPGPLDFHLDDTELAALIGDVIDTSRRFPERPSDWVPKEPSPWPSHADDGPTRSWAYLIRRMFTGR